MASGTPPTLTHYQRLQGYARVVQNLVWNPESGDFEVEAQSMPTVPTAGLNPTFAMVYDGSQRLSYVDKTVGGTTWRKTLTYGVDDLVSSVSEWVEQ